MRLGAAATIAKSVSTEMGPTIRAALDAEVDGEVREKLSLAIAQLDLEGEDPARRLAAVQTIGDLAALSLKPQLERLLKQNDDGSFVLTGTSGFDRNPKLRHLRVTELDGPSVSTFLLVAVFRFTLFVVFHRFGRLWGVASEQPTHDRHHESATDPGL